MSPVTLSANSMLISNSPMWNLRNSPSLLGNMFSCANKISFMLLLACQFCKIAVSPCRIRMKSPSLSQRSWLGWLEVWDKECGKSRLINLDSDVTECMSLPHLRQLSLQFLCMTLRGKSHSVNRHCAWCKGANIYAHGSQHVQWA